VSLFICLLAYAASLIPAQLPTEFLRSPAGVVLTLIDPVESASTYLDRTIGSGQPLSQAWPFLASPVAATLLSLALLFGWAAPRLRLMARA